MGFTTASLKGSGGLFSLFTQTWPAGNYQITLQAGHKIYGGQVIKSH